jgi:hypothetical protein
MIDSDLSPVYICRKCRVKRITFDNSRRGKKGKLIPMEFTDPTRIHVCEQSLQFPCRRCGELIFLDEKVLSPLGKKIPLSAMDSKPHDCPTKVL